MEKKQKIQFLLFDTYFASIKKSAGTKMFQNVYVLDNGKKKDVTENGKNSCAVFTSSILTMHNLTKERHATVEGTLKDMKKSGWFRIKKAKIGAVVLWGPWEKSDHWHTGFCIDKNYALSNDGERKIPKLHHLTYGVRNRKPKRPIESVWWHKSLEK